MFTDQQTQDAKEEEERNLREMIKFEQDKAYQASLEIDRFVNIVSCSYFPFTIFFKDKQKLWFCR